MVTTVVMNVDECNWRWYQAVYILGFFVWPVQCAGVLFVSSGKRWWRDSKNWNAMMCEQLDWSPADCHVAAANLWFHLAHFRSEIEEWFDVWPAQCLQFGLDDLLRVVGCAWDWFVWPVEQRGGDDCRDSISWSSFCKCLMKDKCPWCPQVGCCKAMPQPDLGHSWSWRR